MVEPDDFLKKGKPTKILKKKKNLAKFLRPSLHDQVLL